MRRVFGKGHDSDHSLCVQGLSESKAKQQPKGMGVRGRLAGKKEASKRGRGIREGSALGQYSQSTTMQCGQKFPERNLTSP